MERPPSLIHGNWQLMVLFHAMASRHIAPLSSMVFHNPWYYPKEHCNNVIKKPLWLLNKAFKEFWHPPLLLFYCIIGLLVLSVFLSMVWEVRLKELSLSLTPPCHIFTLCLFVYSIQIPDLVAMYFSQVAQYVISYPPLSASKPPGSQPPRSRSVVLEHIRSPWEWGFEHSSSSNICKYF